MKSSLSHRKGFFVVVILILCYSPKAWSWNYTRGQGRGRGRARPRARGVHVPCLYIFGDSLVDNGNNNDMLTLAKANYQPYGVDFPQGATGRFTNGRTFVDALAQILGFSDFIPPFSTVQRSSILRGANFASGASGIREETGSNLGEHISMDGQVRNFQRILPELRRQLGDRDGVQKYMRKCIFYSGLGSNDYLNNYFMTNYYDTSSQFTPAAYADSLLQDYSRQLTELYQLGARKVIVTGLGQIGCIPYELARYNGTQQSRCNEEKNNIVNLFNFGLRQLVDKFNNGQLPGSMFVYLDSYKSFRDLFSNPISYGLEVVDRACCGVGKNNGQITCLPFQQPCENRNKHLFWDAFHPTAVANVLLANKAYSSTANTYAYPINVRQLALL